MNLDCKSFENKAYQSKTMLTIASNLSILQKISLNKVGPFKVFPDQSEDILNFL